MREFGSDSNVLYLDRDSSYTGALIEFICFIVCKFGLGIKNKKPNLISV